MMSPTRSYVMLQGERLIFKLLFHLGARRNSTRLHDYLRQQGVEVWVEPRVVWAGEGKLWLKKPAVRVWQLADPDYMLEDIERGKTISADVLAEANTALGAIRP